MTPIPQTMRAVRLEAYGRPPRLEVRQVPVPYPGHGQVLVRLHGAAMHPSDLLFCEGSYGFRRALPTTPGFEGFGTVVGSGGGFVANLLKGRRVACGVQDQGEGLWAEYAVVDAATCVPLWRDLDDTQAAMLLVNPMTAIALLQTARESGHRAGIQTAAAGALGRMIARLARKRGFPLVHVVRRPEQAALLEAEGMERVVVSGSDDFDAQLRRASAAVHATVAFDAVGGPLTRRLLAAMPDGSEALVYGLLDSAPVEVTGHDLVFARKAVRGFWLGPWLADQGITGIARLGPQLRRHADVLRSEVAGEIGLDEVPATLDRYAQQMTRGKFVVRP